MLSDMSPLSPGSPREFSAIFYFDATIGISTIFIFEAIRQQPGTLTHL
jgi:hypothetical protein